MDVALVVVPWDSAQRDVRMGAGPGALLPDLADRLARAGHRVATSTVDPPDGSFRAEVRTAFELAAGIAARVRAARATGRFPIVLAGNCHATVGVVAGLGAGTTVLWCDAHGDFNTPETTVGGFLDGMALAVVTGRCWTALARGVPGFAPVAERDVWLAGARDLDPGEREALDGSAVRRVAAAQIGPALAARVQAARPAGAPLALHLDLDVLDPSVGRANGLAAPGGASAAGLVGLCGALGASGASGGPAALTLSAYDPACDADGGVRAAALDAVAALLGAPA